MTALGLDSKNIGGCASIEHESTELLEKSFSMWIGALNHDKLRCREQGAYNELLYKYNTKYYAASAALRKLSHINDNTPCTCLHVAYSYLI